MKKKIYYILMAGLLLLLAASCSNKLHTGWTNAKNLQQKGYHYIAPLPKHKAIYIRRTQDSTKANIIKIKK